MLYATLITGIICVTVCVIALVSYALRALQSAQDTSQTFAFAHNNTLKTLEAVHAKNIAQTQDVLDRFMALDFSLFKAYQSAENAEFGGFSDPTGNEEEELGQVIAFTDSGAPRDINAGLLEDLAARANEESLLAEDFGLEFDQKEGFTP